MTLDELAGSLQKAFRDVPFTVSKGEAGDPWIETAPERIPDVLDYLKANFGLEYLACLTGIDYGDRMGVVYNVRSLGKGFDVTLKVYLPRDNPIVPTIKHIFGVADWFEREAYDLLGIRFDGHDDLRRILLPEDWDGYPLRKDYKPPESYHGIPCHRPNPLDLLTPSPVDSQTTDKIKRIMPKQKASSSGDNQGATS